MSTLNAVADQVHEQTRSHWWWMLLGGVALAQLFAFWLLCSHQMRMAEVRHNEAVIQQMALADCLQYIPGSTIASCSIRVDTNAPPAHPAEKAALTGAVPVSFSYR